MTSDETETPGPARRRTVLFRGGSLFVDAERTGDGGVVIAGQDLSAGADYEYWLTVIRDQVPALVAALGGEPGDDVLVLLGAAGESIVRHGELRWLRDHGVVVRFASHGDWPMP